MGSLLASFVFVKVVRIEFSFPTMNRSSSAMLVRHNQDGPFADYLTRM